MNYKPYIAVGAIALVAVFAFNIVGWFSPQTNDDMSSNIIVASSSDDDTLISPDDPSLNDVVSSNQDDSALQNAPIAPKKPASVNKNSNSTSQDTAADEIVSTLPTPTLSSSSPSPQSSLCSFPADASAPSRKIIFNEIAWMGSSSSANDEWMELKNISGSDINLSGWSVMNRLGKITINFSSGDSIASSGFLVLARNNSSTGISYSGTLSNAGDVLAILDPQCDVSDVLDASSGWPAGNNTTKQTLERDADGVGWHTSASSGGTPGAENSFVIPPPAPITTSSVSGSESPPSENNTQAINVNDPVTQTTNTTSSLNSNSGDSGIANNTSTASTTTVNTSGSNVLISVVQISGASSTNDLVKLYNPTSAAIDMSGWKLHKRSQTGTEYSLKEFPNSTSIAPGQTFIWANSAGGFSETVGANVSSTETLSTDNSVALLDSTGAVIDAVGWGTGTNQFGEGSPYPTDPTNGQLLARQSANGTLVNTNNNANDFTLQ